MWVYPLNLIGGILSVILFTLGAFDSSMYGKAVYPSSFEYGTRQKPGSPIPSKFWTLEGKRIDQPKPIITTDGPLGTPGSFRLPEAYVVSGETNSLQISKVGQTPSSKISIAAMRSIQMFGLSLMQTVKTVVVSNGELTMTPLLHTTIARIRFGLQPQETRSEIQSSTIIRPTWIHG